MAVAADPVLVANRIDNIIAIAEGPAIPTHPSHYGHSFQKLNRIHPDCHQELTTVQDNHSSKPQSSIISHEEEEHKIPNHLQDSPIVDDQTLFVTSEIPLKQPLTLSRKIMQFFQDIHHYCLRIVKSVYKYIIYLLTGNCELIRICSENDRRHTYLMTIKFTQSLKQSQQLTMISNLIKFPKLFTVNDILVEILTNKRIKSKSPVIIANMKTCLQSIRLVNQLCVDCHAMRTIAFDYSQFEHIQLLEKLWSNLKPGIVRSTNRLSEEWGDLGFQGRDPSTDFRGMGLLSLQQLVYFSEKYPTEAQKILSESSIESRYFPFAAVGINITAFVIELLNGLHMHRFIFQHMDEIMLQDVTNSDDGPSADKNCVALATSYVHELYCKVFVEFGKIWIKQSPKDVMSFPTIFNTFKKQIKLEYEAL
jgi:hypothetical protein